MIGTHVYLGRQREERVSNGRSKLKALSCSIYPNVCKVENFLLTVKVDRREIL